MKAVLLEVNLDTGELVTLDGHNYSVNPGDLPTCCTWSPLTVLEINKGKGYIRNLEIDVTVNLL